MLLYVCTCVSCVCMRAAVLSAMCNRLPVSSCFLSGNVTSSIEKLYTRSCTQGSRALYGGSCEMYVYSGCCDMYAGFCSCMQGRVTNSAPLPCVFSVFCIFPCWSSSHLQVRSASPAHSVSSYKGDYDDIARNMHAFHIGGQGLALGTGVPETFISM